MASSNCNVLSFQIKIDYKISNYYLAFDKQTVQCNTRQKMKCTAMRVLQIANELLRGSRGQTISITISLKEALDKQKLLKCSQIKTPFHKTYRKNKVIGNQTVLRLFILQIKNTSAIVNTARGAHDTDSVWNFL
jgi:hypothetical protein